MELRVALTQATIFSLLIGFTYYMTPFHVFREVRVTSLNLLWWRHLEITSDLLLTLH